MAILSGELSTSSPIWPNGIIFHQARFGCQPKNRGKTPQIIHLFIGFSIIFTIHFGGFPPIFGNTNFPGNSHSYLHVTTKLPKLGWDFFTSKKLPFPASFWGVPSRSCTHLPHQDLPPPRIHPNPQKSQGGRRSLGVSTKTSRKKRRPKRKCTHGPKVAFFSGS